MTTENTAESTAPKKKDDPIAGTSTTDNTKDTGPQSGATRGDPSSALVQDTWNDIFKLKSNVSDHKLTAINDTGEGESINWFADPSLAEFWAPASGAAAVSGNKAEKPPAPAEKEAGFWDFLGDLNPANLFKTADATKQPDKPTAVDSTDPNAEKGFLSKAWDSVFDWAFKKPADNATKPTDFHVGMDASGKVGEAGMTDGSGGKTVTDGKQITHTDAKGNTITEDLKTGEKTAKSGDGKNEYTETVNAQGQKEQNWKDDDGRQIRRTGEKYEIRSPEGPWTEFTPDGRMTRVLQNIGEHELRVTQMTRPVASDKTLAPAANEVVTAKTADGKGIAKYRDNDGNILEVSEKGNVITTKGGAVFVVHGSHVMMRGADGKFHNVSESDLPAGVTQLANGGVQVGGMKIQTEANGGVTTDGKRVRCQQDGDKRNITIADATDPTKKVEIQVNTANGASTVDWPDHGGKTTVSPDGVAKILDSKGHEVATYDHGHVSNDAIDFAPNGSVTMKWSGDTINSDGSVTLSNGSSLRSDATYQSAAGATQGALQISQTAIGNVSAKFGNTLLTDADLGDLKSALGSLSSALALCIQSGNLEAMGAIIAAQGSVSSVLGTAEPLVKLYSDLRGQGLSNSEIGEAQKYFHGKTIAQAEEEANMRHNGGRAVQSEELLRNAS